MDLHPHSGFAHQVMEKVQCQDLPPLMVAQLAPVQADLSPTGVLAILDFIHLLTTVAPFPCLQHAAHPQPPVLSVCPPAAPVVMAPPLTVHEGPVPLYLVPPVMVALSLLMSMDPVLVILEALSEA